MAIKRGNVSERLIGLSSDTKPIDKSVKPGWEFIELDTGLKFIFDGWTWHDITFGANSNVTSPVTVLGSALPTNAAQESGGNLAAAKGDLDALVAAAGAGIAQEAGGNLAALEDALVNQQTVTPVEDPTAAANLHERLAGLKEAIGTLDDGVNATPDVSMSASLIGRLTQLLTVFINADGNDGGPVLGSTGDMAQVDWTSSGTLISFIKGLQALNGGGADAIGGWVDTSTTPISNLSVFGQIVQSLGTALNSPAYATILDALNDIASDLDDFYGWSSGSGQYSFPAQVLGRVMPSTPLVLELVSLATRESADIAVTGSGLNLVVTLANKANSGSFTPKVQGKTASGDYYDLWIAAAALTANGAAVYQLGRSASTVTQVTESKVVQLPAIVRVVLTSDGNGTTDAFDTTVDIDVTP